MNDALIGKCGFCCACCPTYIRGGCQGCMEEHVAGDCYTRDCVLEKGLFCCGECAQFPCDVLLERPRVTVLDKSWLRWKQKSTTNH